MKIGKALLRRPFVQRALGTSFAGWFGLVHGNSRLVSEPVDTAAVFREHGPAIVAIWHGQHFLVPFAAPTGVRFAVMIARNAEANVNAIAVEKLGMTAIRASGSRKASTIRRKGGVVGFLEAVRALEDGISIAMTADVPVGPARIAGRGIVLLAQHSGRPILPVAYVTARRLTLPTWDRAALNLPYGRAGLVVGAPLYVAADADDAAVEAARATLDARLDAANGRAYELAGVTNHRYRSRPHG